MSPALKAPGFCFPIVLAGGFIRVSNRSIKMARKPGTRTEFVTFDVFYEDGTQRSNRKVPSTVLGGLDGDAPARTVIEEQDRVIAEKSGVPAMAIKEVRRSGGK